MVMVFSATFNNISAISWQSVLLVEETGVPGENHRPAASHWQLNHIMLYQIHLAFERDSGVEGIGGKTHWYNSLFTELNPQYCHSRHRGEGGGHTGVHSGCHTPNTLMILQVDFRIKWDSVNIEDKNLNDHINVLEIKLEKITRNKQRGHK